MKCRSCKLNLLCFAGHNHKCYRCSSYIGWSHCDDAKKEVTCASNSSDHRCVKLHFDRKVRDQSLEVYYRGCWKKEHCHNHGCKALQIMNVTKCKEVSCCEGDLCNGAKVSNGAKVPMVSAILLFACALVFLFR